MVIGINASNAQTINSTEADLAWNDLLSTAISFNPRFISKDSLKTCRELQELHNRRFRDEGLKFWNKYPKDPRRYVWFYQTVGPLSPRYWKDVNHGAELVVEKQVLNPVLPIDIKALNEWELIYPGLKREYLNTPSSAFPKDVKDYKGLLLHVEFISYLECRLNPFYRSEKKLDLKVTSSLFKEAAETFYGPGYNGFKINVHINAANRTLKTLQGMLLGNAKLYGLTNEELVTFIKPFKKSANAYIKEGAIQFENVLNIKRHPFSFKATSLEGKEYDFEQMKGKVVFFDFWSTSCHTCIAKMPKLKQVYDKYKDKGFEVLSVSLNYDIHAKGVKAVHDKIGADWPVFIIGGKSYDDSTTSLGTKILKTYGWSSVPKLLLFNKKGELVEYQGLLLNGDYESLVKELLAEEYSK